MTAEITWPVQTAVPVPLPNLGRCSGCDTEVRIRGNGLPYKHDRPHHPDAPIVVATDGYLVTGCPGGYRKPAELLEPTFARWLWMQSKRRDDYTNRLTLLAGRLFRTCTRSPNRTARDVEWATADELHGYLHLVQLARAGTELRNPPAGERCDWMCRDVAEAAAIYQQLIDVRRRGSEAA